MNRATKVGTLMLAATPLISTAAAAEKEQRNDISVEDRRWTLDVGLADARHRSLSYPNDSARADGVRYEPQTVRAPHEFWGLDLSVSYRLPKGAGRLTGRAFLENLGDGVGLGSVGLAIPYELPDGTRGTMHRYVDPSIGSLWSHNLTWSRGFSKQGAYSLRHELGFVARRLGYGVNSSSLGQGSYTTLYGPRLGLSATRRLAHGAALEVVLGCAVARRTEKANTAVPVSYPGVSTYEVTDRTSRSWRLVPDANLALHIPLSERLAGTLGYRWEGYGRTFVGRVSTYGAFLALKIGIGG